MFAISSPDEFLLKLLKHVKNAHLSYTYKLCLCFDGHFATATPMEPPVPVLNVSEHLTSLWAED